MLEYQQEKLQPLTFKLVMKYATDHSAAIEAKMKKLEGSEAGDSKKIQEEPEQIKEEKKEPSRPESPEDQEAMIVHERKKIDDAMRQSQTSFMQKATKQSAAEKQRDPVMPTINRRLGGGLAAAVKAKGLAAAITKKQTKKQNLVKDDDSYYDDEEDEDEDELEESKRSTQIETASERPSTSTSARGVNHYEILRETLETPSRAERTAKATKI